MPVDTFHVSRRVLIIALSDEKQHKTLLPALRNRRGKTNLCITLKSTAGQSWEGAFPIAGQWYLLSAGWEIEAQSCQSWDTDPCLRPISQSE